MSRWNSARVWASGAVGADCVDGVGLARAVRVPRWFAAAVVGFRWLGVRGGGLARSCCWATAFWDQARPAAKTSQGLAIDQILRRNMTASRKGPRAQQRKIGGELSGSAPRGATRVPL